MSGRSPSGSWWLHNFLWSDALKKDQLCKNLVLVFEEMLADPSGTVVKLANFLGCKESLTQDKLNSIVRESSFEKMKSDSKHFMWRYDKKFNSQFFRSGMVGRWKERLTEEQSRRIEERTSEWIARGFSVPIYYEPLPSSKNQSCGTEDLR